MFRLLSYLKQCKKSVLAIVLLLIVQAYCDLALPQYTSDIVDVGIQQGGITYAAPEWMREETWGSLQNLMTEGEKELTASCYEQAEDGTYERTTNKNGGSGSVKRCVPDADGDAVCDGRKCGDRDE